MPPPTHRIIRTLSAAVLPLLLITACSESTAHDDTGDPTLGADEDHYPVTVENCGYEVEFSSAPEQVALMETAPVTVLDGLGVFDHTVVRAGDFSEDYYTADLSTEIQSVPSLSEDLDAAGHFALSQEEIIAYGPDLVLGLPDGVSRQGLQDSSAAVLEQEIYCPDFSEDAAFDHVYAEIERYGEIFAVAEEAEQMVAELSERVEAAGENAAAEDRTAAVLYPSVGSGPVYAYGTGSMAHAQLETLGFENVFADTSERVFEVQTEELVGRDPDILILLYQGEVDGVEETVLDLPGIEAMTAIQEDAVITQLFNFTEPATPLSVDGLELIADHFQDS